MYDEFPWIKFGLLTLLFVIPIVIYTDGLKWKLLYSFAVPVGIYIALIGKSIGKSHGPGGG